MVQKENLHLKEEKLYEISCSDRKQSEKEMISEIHKEEISENEEEIPESCNYCDKKFKSRNALNYHKKIVHGIEKPFSCKFCDKFFKMKHHLDSHERTHTTEKPFSCDLCEKSYTQGHSLQLHKKKLHGIIQVILYKSSSELLETVKDSFSKLANKLCTHLVEISISPLNHVFIRLTKIMNNLVKDRKILTFKN